jgi:hypothetical protein
MDVGLVIVNRQETAGEGLERKGVQKRSGARGCSGPAATSPWAEYVPGCDLRFAKDLISEVRRDGNAVFFPLVSFDHEQYP